MWEGESGRTKEKVREGKPQWVHAILRRCPLPQLLSTFTKWPMPFHTPLHGKHRLKVSGNLSMMPRSLPKNLLSPWLRGVVAFLENFFSLSVLRNPLQHGRAWERRVLWQQVSRTADEGKVTVFFTGLAVLMKKMWFLGTWCLMGTHLFQGCWPFD